MQSWTEDHIVFRIAPGRSSGLLRVQTDGGVSNAVFLTVPADIPRVVREQRVRIESISPTTIGPGSVMRILGFGFGPRSVLAEIRFTGAGSDESTTVDGMSSWVVHWSNREIRLVVPPGIGEGPLEIAINGEALEDAAEGVLPDLPVSRGPIRTRAVLRRVRVAGLDPAIIEQGVYVTLPRVPVTTGQTSVQLLREEGERVGAVGDGAWLYRLRPASGSSEDPEEDPGILIQRTDYVERHALELRFPEDVPALESAVLRNDDFRTAFADLLGPVAGMSPEDPVISRIGEEILAGYRNPLAIARTIHEQVAARLVPAPQKEPGLKESVTGGRGSSRDYADLAALLARWAGIPARRQIGAYLDEAGRTRPHAWVEFFVPGFGWIPADPALSDGIYGERGDDEAESEVSFFGSLDDRRIALYTDGTPAARPDPGATLIEPAAPYAPGLQWVALPGDLSPEELESISVEWMPPEIIPD